MINANELRISNWVNEKVLGNVMVDGVVSNVAFLIKKYDSFHYSINYENIEPIPLTPEILAKCSINLLDWFCEGSFKIREDRADLLFGWTFVVRNANHDKEIEFGYFKYVHQLQNTYFALTQNELPINNLP